MKRLLVVILAAAVLWSGYWFVGARSLKSSLEGWFAARRDEGWQADYAALHVRGFPNRFDTTFDAPVLSDPASGWTWQAPFLQFLALSYRPTRVIAVVPHEMTLTNPVDSFGITSTDLKASIALDPAPRLPLDHANLVGSDIVVQGANRTSVATLRLATSLLAGATQDYRYGLLAEDLRLPDAVLNRLGQDITLTESIDRLELDASVAFDAPWDLDALETTRPQPQRIDLRVARADWGQMKLSATGSVTVGPDGLPTGTLSLRAERWRDMLRMALSAGVMTEAEASSTTRALAVIAGLTGDPETLDVTLDLRDGLVALGPVVLGPAPVLRLR